MKSAAFHTLAIAMIASQPAMAGPDFVEDIQPILELNCVRCHNEDRSKGGLSMETYGALLKGGDEADALVPGDPEASEMLIRVNLRPIDDGIMPQKGRLLEPEQIALLEEWVKAGAPWPKDVVLTERKPEPIKRVSIPDRAPASAAEAATILDDILARENTGTDTITTPTIDDLTFLRRATIDIIGRIPTVKEIAEFESWDGDRREKLVTKLLAHPRFAERWTIFMADMLRIRSNVSGGNQLLAYVNESLAEEKRYDQLVHEIISASGSPKSNPAVGFILAENADPLELAATTSQTFLGVRIGCAMCHDHPFDDWEQRDLYRMAAYFGKTEIVSNRNRGMVYATEGEKMSVMWPPEDKAEPDKRRALRPKFPIDVDKTSPPLAHVARYLQTHAQLAQQDAAGSESDSLDALMDAADPIGKQRENPVLAEAEKESRQLNVHSDIYRASELRNELAELIANPHNEFFAKAFVNRMWAELIGHGFVEPLDNFSPYVDMKNPSTLDFLSQEFVASGFDIKHLIKIITLSDAYRRSNLPADTPFVTRENSEKHFTAAPLRRMIGEVLYDSIVEAGHLKDYKWPAGANNKEVTRQIRVPTGEYITVENSDAPKPEAMMPAPMKRSDGYELESSLTLDFNSILSPEEKNELDTMRKESDEEIKAREMAAMMKESQRQVMKYKIETITEIVDDNPRFDSAMRMATPAPPSHFLRVFGQPSRASLGEFRDDSPSLRQQLMMLNGRLTHEASRVGPLEPLHDVLKKDTAAGIDYAYKEILTRLPTAEEKADALQLLSDDPFEGMSDLRWALLNSNEFRFIP